MNKTLTLKPVDYWEQYYGIGKDFYTKLGGVDKIITEERKSWNKTVVSSKTGGRNFGKNKTLENSFTKR